MEHALLMLESHGYWVIFLVVLIDFLGAPITSIPLLVTAGALAAAGKLSLAVIVLLAAAAAAVGDSLWYGVGRFKGQRVLGAMCKLSRNRRVCVERSARFVTKFGVTSLLASKFLPGIATVAPPAAGTASMPVWKFLLLDGAGSLLWATGFSVIGYALSEQTHRLLSALNQFGNVTTLALAALAASVLLVSLARGIARARQAPTADEAGVGIAS